jgi:ribose/xylose/arabinose/galactoside ABC-type transport system permease subunit
MEKLSVKGLTISIGALGSYCTLLMGITAMFGYGTVFVKDLSSIYIGYDATPIGILLGLVYGFLDGAVAGFIISYVYNLVVERLK